MPTRNYSSTAGIMQLVSPATSVATTIAVDAVGGLPVVPFTLVLDPGTSSEEIITVTDVSGTTLTVVRHEDGSSAVAHAAGANVRHMATAEEGQVKRLRDRAWRNRIRNREWAFRLVAGLDRQIEWRRFGRERELVAAVSAPVAVIKCDVLALRAFHGRRAVPSRFGPCPRAAPSSCRWMVVFNSSARTRSGSP